MTPDEYKAHREKLGITQAELAARLGVTRKTINRREAGDATITTEAELSIRSLTKGKRPPLTN
jgi:DNA-binding XRE family transcriptional regulator